MFPVYTELHTPGTANLNQVQSHVNTYWNNDYFTGETCKVSCA